MTGILALAVLVAKKSTTLSKKQGRKTRVDEALGWSEVVILENPFDDESYIEIPGAQKNQVVMSIFGALALIPGLLIGIHWRTTTPEMLLRARCNVK